MYAFLKDKKYSYLLPFLCEKGYSSAIRYETSGTETLPLRSSEKIPPHFLWKRATRKWVKESLLCDKELLAIGGFSRVLRGDLKNELF